MVFKPGNCANPNGRPKGKRKFPFTKSQLEKYFNQWVDLVENGRMSDAVRLRATRDLVEYMSDRFYGKPQQAVSVSADKPLAAIVNISLAGSTPDEVAAALPAQPLAIPSNTSGPSVNLNNKTILVHENKKTREVNSTEQNGISSGCSTEQNNDSSNDVPDWI